MSNHLALCTGTCTDAVADIVFVVDSSGSIRKANPQDSTIDNYDLLLEFVANLTDLFTVGQLGVRVGLTRFSNTGDNVFALNAYDNKADLRSAILGVGYMDGNTNTSGGIRAMRQQFTSENGDRDFAKNIAVILTDGESTMDVNLTIPDAIAAREAGIEIYVVGITDQVNVEELRLMSSEPQVRNRNYFLTSEFSTLQAISDGLVSQTCAVGTLPGKLFFFCFKFFYYYVGFRCNISK